jgi:CheY-like chemotaxis protein
VEDEEAIADLIEMTLVQAGYRCDKALDGELAADLIEEGGYDLILLDIMLPGADGYELMDFISGTAPVIFLMMCPRLLDQKVVEKTVRLRSMYPSAWRRRSVSQSAVGTNHVVCVCPLLDKYLSLP